MLRLAFAAALTVAAFSSQAAPRGAGRDDGLHNSPATPDQSFAFAAPDPRLAALNKICRRAVRQEFRIVSFRGKGGKITAARQFRIDACVRNGGPF